MPLSYIGTGLSSSVSWNGCFSPTKASSTTIRYVAPAVASTSSEAPCLSAAPQSSGGSWMLPDAPGVRLRSASDDPVYMKIRLSLATPQSATRYRDVFGAVHEYQTVPSP